MSLRLRLIVAFFLFSVVPLAAVTLLLVHEQPARAAGRGAARNGDAHRRADPAHAGGDDADQRARRALHGYAGRRLHHGGQGTTGRTRSSTPAGSKRTGVAASDARAAPPRPLPPRGPAGAIRPRVPRHDVTARNRIRSTMEGQVAGALGEVAMLLNNVEVRGLGRLGGRLADLPIRRSRHLTSRGNSGRIARRCRRMARWLRRPRGTRRARRQRDAAARRHSDASPQVPRTRRGRPRGRAASAPTARRPTARVRAGILARRLPGPADRTGRGSHAPQDGPDVDPARAVSRDGAERHVRHDDARGAAARRARSESAPPRHRAGPATQRRRDSEEGGSREAGRGRACRTRRRGRGEGGTSAPLAPVAPVSPTTGAPAPPFGPSSRP